MKENDIRNCNKCSASLDRDGKCHLCDYAHYSDTTTKLPLGIQDFIYKACCCKPTPEEAQKESCACVAAHIVEVIEGWAAQVRESYRDE